MSMSDKIIFYTSQNSNRLQYTINLIFHEILGLNIVFTMSKNLYQESNLPKIHYGDIRLSDDEYFIKEHALIFENYIIKRDFAKEFHEFDIFSKIFVLVSRYEEYIRGDDSTEIASSRFDAHGRFNASASIASELGFLQQPVVNQWVMEIKESLLQHFPYLKIPPPQYKLQLTYDIDQAWAFKNKGLLRNIGGFFTDLLNRRFKNAFDRLSVIVHLNNDPQYTFDYIEKLHKKYEHKISEQPVFFWLLGDYGKFDKNISWGNKSLQRLIRRMSKKYKMGIHPSYASNTGLNILKMEIERLRKILKSDTEGVFLSRQHFLKLTFPNTYRNLIRVGIQSDYTMGYADNIGFRAGIATPFYWYDLGNEEVTNLKIYPFQVMEVTLKEYLKLSPDEVIAYVKPMIEATQAVGGTFTTLWHNSTLSETEGYEGWRRVYHQILEEA